MYSHKKICNHKQAWLIWHWRGILFLAVHERDSFALHCSNSSESELVRESLHCTVRSSHVWKQGLVFLSVKSVHASPTWPHTPPEIQPPDSQLRHAELDNLESTFQSPKGNRVARSPLASSKQETRKAHACQAITYPQTHQANSVTEALEDHDPQKTLMNQTCSPSYKRCYCLLSPSLHHNINKIPNSIKTPQCFYLLMSSDSNCNVLSSLPLPCTAQVHTGLPFFMKLDN